MASECFKIVDKATELEFRLGLTKLEIETPHPPEAIEEIEVPVIATRYVTVSPEKETEAADVEIGKIKLHRCKLCGIILLEKGE